MEIVNCNHCNKQVNIEKLSLRTILSAPIDETKKSRNFELEYYICPLCGEISIYLTSLTDHEMSSKLCNDKIFLGKSFKNLLVYPKYIKPKDLSKFIPEGYVNDYNECVQVLTISPKACAVLCRRLCEILLRDVAGCKKYRLESKIDEFIENKKPQSPLLEFLPYLKLAGDSTAHDKRDDISNLVVEVTKEDCEILLETIELLFDFLFVQPNIKAEKLKQLAKFDNSKTTKV